MTKVQKGNTLIEALMVVVVIGLVIYLLASIPNAMRLVSQSKNISLAREIASKQIEDKRNINFTNLVNDTQAITDSRINLLPQGSGIVVIEDCNPAICTNSENIKAVTVTVSWDNNNKSQNVTLNTFIGEGGISQ